MEPLATRLRPRTLDEVLGQEKILHERAPFRKSMEQKQIGSTIFWGPPGCGKTTLARLMAEYSARIFAQLSAVQDGMPAFKKKIKEAEGSRLLGGMLLFVDEIHRWNKSQQDALLPHVESGLIVLVGATTENPSFSVNPALRSRCWIIKLEALNDDDLLLALRRGVEELKIHAQDEVLIQIAAQSSGDARRALSILERIAPSVVDGNLTQEILEQADLSKDLLHDAKGESHYSVVSAFIKSMRGSDPDSALYWMARMIEGGEDALFIARRMVIFASEDIGNADLRALPLAVSAMQTIQLIGMPEARITLGQACVYLACAPKSNATYSAVNAALSFVRTDGSRPVPANIADPPKGYRYPHDYAYGFVEQNYWPEDIPKRSFYKPTTYGDEKVIGQRLAWWKSKTKS